MGSTSEKLIGNLDFLLGRERSRQRATCQPARGPRAPTTFGHALNAARENAAPAFLRHASPTSQPDPRSSADPIPARRNKPNQRPAIHPNHCFRIKPTTRDCRKPWARDTCVWNLRVVTSRHVAGAWKRV